MGMTIIQSAPKGRNTIAQAEATAKAWAIVFRYNYWNNYNSVSPEGAQYNSPGWSDSEGLGQKQHGISKP